MTGEATDLVARLNNAWVETVSPSPDGFRRAMVANVLNEARAATQAHATLIEAQAAEIEGLRKAVEEAVTAAMWSEKALERYDNALGLDVDEAALIALSKCKDFVERYDTHRTTQEGPNP